MSAPRRNLILFVIYLIAALGVFIGALLFPSFRSNAYAPLRELIIPPPKPIVVDLLYSTEKTEWLDEIVVEFYQSKPTIQGHPVEINMKKMGSREMYLAVLDGEETPALISPASSLQISILQELSSQKFGHPIVNLNDKTTCESVLNTPLVLVAWRDRAKVMWGDQPPKALWHALHDDLVDPQGWGAFGKSEWGYVKFGQTNPLKSNSGFMTILLMTYGYFDKETELKAADIQDDREYQEWLLDIQGSISKFGDSTGTYMRDIVAYGPSMYDIVAVYEAAAIEQADNAVGRYGELRVYYPPATIMSDHPFCIMDAEWVSPEQQEAARLFMDFLLQEESQELALTRYGFRPAISGISLEMQGSPFTKYATNGLEVNLPPEVEIPDGTVLNTLLDFWTRNVNP